MVSGEVMEYQPKLFYERIKYDSIIDTYYFVYTQFYPDDLGLEPAMYYNAENKNNIPYKNHTLSSYTLDKLVGGKRND